MTEKEKDIMIECISGIRTKIETLTGKQREAYLLSCRDNIELNFLNKSTRRLFELPEYLDYREYVNEQLRA
jgi:hypothetical protein